MEWVTSTTLLGRLRSFENRTAWGGFVERFGAPIAGFARRLGVPEQDLDDVTQEALASFAKAYRSGRYDRARGRLSAWLFGIAYRTAMRQRERDARAVDRAARLTELDVVDPKTAGALWEHEWKAAVLEKCLARARVEFSAETFRAFELVTRHGRSAVEAAQELGAPVKTIYNAKHRVLRRVRALSAEMEHLGARLDPRVPVR